jgi:hypothetical protein
MDSGSVADTSRDGRFDAQPFAQWRIIGYYLSRVQIELDLWWKMSFRIHAFRMRSAEEGPLHIQNPIQSSGFGPR